MFISKVGKSIETFSADRVFYKRGSKSISLPTTVESESKE